MKTFKRFIENRLVEAAPPGPAGGGIGGPGALPPPGPGGGMPPPPMGGGMGVPPPPMGMGGGLGMPPAPPAPGAAPGGTPDKLKAYNVWDVLERVLGGQPQKQ